MEGEEAESGISLINVGETEGGSGEARAAAQTSLALFSIATVPHRGRERNGTALYFPSRKAHDVCTEVGTRREDLCFFRCFCSE